MSDYASSLPIRTESNGDAAVKIVDGTITSQQLTVNADGSINITDNSSSLTVDAVNLDIRDLAFATDKVDVSGSEVELGATTLAALESITVQNGAGASAVNIQDGGNSITVDATNLDIRDLAFATDKVDVTGSSVELGATTLAALETITVTATDLDIRDLTHVSDSVKIGDGTDFLAVNTDGSINVNISDSTPGTPVNDYNTAAAVAANATSTHDYTVTAAKTLTFNQIEASGSGKMKIQVSVETGVASGVFTTRFVQFSSTAQTNMSIHLDNPISVAAGVRVRVIRTNRDNQAQDLYSTICGYELP
jgi:hypothetical protein